MAYDVVKTIGGRQYRYRVQSERDPQTGKTRNRWTYAGRVTAQDSAAARRSPRGNARERLLEATQLLLQTGDASAVTADAIAVAAGVAHGTFYRYFRDRSHALEEVARHIRSRHGIDGERLLDDTVGSVAAARATLRRWAGEKLHYARANRATVCAWHALVAGDERLVAYRDERRDASYIRLRDHLAALRARGYTDVTDPGSTAAALIALVDGIMRRSVLEADRLDDAAIDAAADIVERAIFARL